MDAKGQNSYQNEEIAPPDRKKKMTRVEMNQRFHQKVFEDGTFNIPIRYMPIDNRILSCGGEGIVILAHDRETHQDVVIKKRRTPFSLPYLAKRTHREFVLTQMVNHKNVIRLLNAFTPQKTFTDFSEIYLVTEFINFPLYHLIKNREQVFLQPNGGEIMSYLVYQILCGIKHLHKAGIIHRDLSVSNIVVDMKSQLKIIDLGSSRPEDGLQNMTGYVGARYYRAPEIVLGIDKEQHKSCMLYDRKVDLWSVGCILAEMIIGKPLFPGTNNFEQWNKIVLVVGSPNQSFIQELPEGIKNFVEQSPRYEPKPWTEIIPDSEFPQVQSQRQYSLPKINAHAARDLLSKLLVIDPATRISVDQALELPYVMWQQEPGELDNETNPFQLYNGYIEQLELGENEWKTLIFAELKQYELMKAQVNESSEQRHDCEKCIQYRCECSECNRMDLERLLNPT